MYTYKLLLVRKPVSRNLGAWNKKNSYLLLKCPLPIEQCYENVSCTSSMKAFSNKLKTTDNSLLRVEVSEFQLISLCQHQKNRSHTSFELRLQNDPQQRGQQVQEPARILDSLTASFFKGTIKDIDIGGTRIVHINCDRGQRKVFFWPNRFFSGELINKRDVLDFPYQIVTIMIVSLVFSYCFVFGVCLYGE